MGDSFSSFYQVGSRLPSTTMHPSMLLLCVGLSAAAIVRREAEAEAEPGYGSAPEADPVADPVYGVVVHSVPVKKVTPPVCSTVPEKECVKVPVSTPRKVARTLCDDVVDVTTIEDCHETVTKTCHRSHTSSHSAVVGHETKVVATAVEVPTVPLGAAYHA